jgi:protocatechuate 3,4-dioxygenase alpha subunit
VNPEPTPSQTIGPFFHDALLGEDRSVLVPSDHPQTVRIEGAVYDGAGEPVPDAMVEIWQADADGRYRGDFGWGRSGCDADGRFSFMTVKPGRVGEADAPHVVVMVFARGLLRAVLTRMYFPDEEEANAGDPVLSRLDDGSTLVASTLDGGYEFDVRLQGDGQTVFFAV